MGDQPDQLRHHRYPLLPTQLMRVALTILFFYALSLQARTIYISTAGSDSYTFTQAQNPATPWASITKLNASWSSITAGDTIAFKCGETFYGEIRPGGQGAKNGTASAPIVITSYSTGAKPIISGFVTVSGWTALGGNIYESSAVGTSLSTLEVVTIDGRQYSRGTYPNIFLDSGYATVDTHSGGTSFTDAANPSSSIDWDGASAVLRVHGYILSRRTISSHSGTTFTLSSAVENTIINGNGYFITDHPRTLDRHGEWYFNPTTKTVRLYSAVAPTSLTVKAASLDTLINCYDDDYITIDGVDLEGSEKYGIFYYSSVAATVKNCKIRFMAYEGITCGQSASVNFYAERDTVMYSGDYGINTRGASNNQTIKNCYISNIGIMPAIGGNGTHHVRGITNNGGSGHRYENNRVDSVGYIGIYGFSADILNNVVSNCLLVVDDGAGIYTWNSHSTAIKKISGNMVWNCKGATRSRGDAFNQGYNIYLDDGCANWEVSNNYAWNAGVANLYIHNCRTITIRDNFFYNGWQEQLLLTHETFDTSSNALGYNYEHVGFKIKNNVFFSSVSNPPPSPPGSEQYSIRIYDRRSLTNIQNIAASDADVDSNYYVRPINTRDSLVNIRQNAFTGSNDTHSYYNLAEWKALWGWEANSVGAPVTFASGTSPDDVFRLIYNTSDADSTVTLSQSYRDAKNNVFYAGTYTIAAKTATVLIETSDAAPTPSTLRIKIRNGKARMRSGKIISNQ
jgi:hypothetical protein